MIYERLFGERPDPPDTPWWVVVCFGVCHVDCPVARCSDRCWAFERFFFRALSRASLRSFLALVKFSSKTIFHFPVDCKA